MSYEKQELPTLLEHLRSPSEVFVGSVLLFILVFIGMLFYYVSLRSEFCCGSSLPSVVCGRMSYLRCLCLFAYSGIHLILCFVFLRLVYPMLPVSLDCPFLIAPSIFSNVYLLQYGIMVSIWLHNVKGSK